MKNETSFEGDDGESQRNITGFISLRQYIGHTDAVLLPNGNLRLLLESRRCEQRIVVVVSVFGGFREESPETGIYIRLVDQQQSFEYFSHNQIAFNPSRFMVCNSS